MRKHRIYIPQLASGEYQLCGPEAHHLAKVLRVSTGSAICAFDGKGQEAQGVVRQVSADRVILELTSPQISPVEARWHITLAVALVKGDKMTDIIRQGTELGVVSFVPVICKRCEVRDVSGNKLLRWRRVAQEASKQSGRSLIPEVMPVTRLSDLDVAEHNIVADPESPNRLQQLTAGIPETAQVLALTGPEGGLEDSELEQLVHKGFDTVSLGPRILRAETAPIAVTAALLLPQAR